MYAANSAQISTEKVGEKTVLTVKQEFIANLTGIKEQNESISEAAFEHELDVEHSPQIPAQSQISEQQEESSKWGDSQPGSGGTATANKSTN